MAAVFNHSWTDGGTHNPGQTGGTEIPGAALASQQQVGVSTHLAEGVAPQRNVVRLEVNAHHSGAGIEQHLALLACPGQQIFELVFQGLWHGVSPRVKTLWPLSLHQSTP